MRNRLEIFKEFKEKCPNTVLSLSTMYSCPEYTIEIRGRRVTVTVYVGGGAASFRMYVSGRTVIMQTESVRNEDYSVISDEMDLKYLKEESTVVDLLDKVYSVFDRAIALRETIKDKRRMRLKEAKEKSLSENDELIIRKADIKLEPPFLEILEENYLDIFD